MWIYQTPIGTLKIKKIQNEYFFLFRNDPTPWTGHADPQVVADDVFCRVTGCDVWDDSDIDGPHDLSEWTRI